MPFNKAEFIKNPLFLPGVITALMALCFLGLLVSLTQHKLLVALTKNLNPSVEIVFDDFLFSDRQGKINDEGSLQHLAQQFNQYLKNVPDLTQQWFLSTITVRMDTVDGQSITHPDSPPTSWSDSITVNRKINDQPRSFVFTVDYTYRWSALFLSFAVCWSLLFLVAGILFPKPLTSDYQIERFTLLDSQGSQPPQKLARFVREFVPETGLNPYQERCLQTFYPDVDLDQLGSLIRDARFNDFDEQTWQWFEVGRTLYPGNWEQAFQIALHPDHIEVNEDWSLIIHGIPVELQPTPKAYYFWYLQKRLKDQDEGWVINTDSKKTESTYEQEINMLIERWKDTVGGRNSNVTGTLRIGEARGTATQLNDYRNIIRKAIKAAIKNEDLAEKYLFETQRHRKGMNCYRVRLTADRIIWKLGLR